VDGTPQQEHNSQDVGEGPWDSRHSQEQELAFRVGGGTDRLHQTYNLLSSCRIGIQAGQVSQEICFPSAMHKTLLEQCQNGIENMLHVILCLLVHLGEKFHMFDHFSLLAEDCPK